MTASARSGERPPWFEDRSVLVQMPARMRVMAAYWRLANRAQRQERRDQGHVVGGPFLVRTLGRIRHKVGLDDGVLIEVRGRRILVDVGDTRFPHVLAEVRGDGPWLKILEALLEPGDTFIDVGANHGSISALAGGIVGAQGALVAFEPQPRLARLLERSLAASPVHNVAVHNIACGSERRSATLHSQQGRSGSATLHPGALPAAARKQDEVSIRPISEVIDAASFSGRAVMKFDVEGNEPEALLGASEVIARARPTIIVELNPVTLAAAGHTPLAVLELLQGWGYHFVKEDEFPAVVAVEKIDLHSSQNIVAIPSERDPSGHQRG